MATRKGEFLKKGTRFPQDMTERLTVIRNGKEFEVCPICGAVTNVEFSTPIEEREGYVEGAGQPCDKCNENCGDFFRGC